MNFPIIHLSSEDLARLDKSTQTEWLITNGLGGYASSTVLGMNTHKYHGLLVAALHPPGDRTACLLKLDEDVVIDNKTYRLGVNEFHTTFFPTGYVFLKDFSVSPFPTFTYKVENIVLKKTIGMPYGKNMAIILYHILNKGKQSAKVQLYPLNTCRHFHNIITRKESLVFSQEQSDQDVTLSFLNPKATIITRSTAGQFVSHPNWVEALHYREEDARGEREMDDCYQPGYYEIALNGNDEIRFGVASAASENRDESMKLMELAGYTAESYEGLLSISLQRYSQFMDRFYLLQENVPMSDWLNWILMASDSFIVQDNSGKKSVIAGYFWFESWGRDTFISLPGLMLVTGKFEDARYVLINFSRYCRKGLIPNLIEDKTGDPLYNTVDGTLWYINAVLQYVKYTGDFSFVHQHLWATLKSIIANYEVGTDFAIRMDIDGLIRHGERLTWMDAFADGKAVTPREGKAVEIQALWYNALRTMALFANHFDEKQLAEKYTFMADRTSKSFEKFWDTSRNCLFDVITEPMIDWSMRPNQIIAVSLDYTMLDRDKNIAVVDTVEREFLTPRGLRTLSKTDPRYKGIYHGFMNVRDQAYHNGAAWPWLLGPFTTAYFRAKGYSPQTRDFIADHVFKPLFQEHIYEGGLGTVSEIFDGDPPYSPHGCIAQAWSVAEPLRAYVEDFLQIRPRFEKILAV